MTGKDPDMASRCHCFSGGFVPAFEELTSGQGLAGLYETLQNPAMIAMVGPTPASNAAEYTLERCMQMKCCFLQFVCCCDLCFTRGEPNEKKKNLV